MTFATTAAAVAVATPPISPNPDKQRQSRRTMNSLSLSPNLTRRFLFSFFFSSRHFRPFSASSPIRVPIYSPPSIIRAGVRTGARTDTEAREKLKEEWLASLSCPLTPPRGFAGDGDQKELLDSDSGWVIGVDPDTHGAVALLRGNASDCSAEVFDSPKLSVLIGGRVRKRLDTKSMIELLRSFDAPVGTIAYIEQSMPFPKDGKQGWWCGGFGYGLWIGMLVALGFSVVPVSSASWKKKFELYGSSYTKDDSRKVAATLFPSLSSALGRKKDHGRAEALLIAAYGHGLKMELDSTLALDELIS